MEFAQVKEKLYQSPELASIPDDWEESVPFMCNLDGDQTDAFLYWKHTNKIEVKEMLAVSRRDGQLYALDQKALQERFHLDSMKADSFKIKNYDAYYRDIDRYQQIYEKLSKDESFFQKLGDEAYQLLQKLVGDDLFEKVLRVLADEFLQRLREYTENKLDELSESLEQNEILNNE